MRRRKKIVIGCGVGLLAVAVYVVALVGTEPETDEDIPDEYLPWTSPSPEMRLS